MKPTSISKVTFVMLLHLHLVFGNQTETEIKSPAIVKCFQCNSAENAECADLTQNDTSSPFYQDCSDYSKNGHHEPFCRKVQDTIKTVKDHEEIRTVRSCGWILEKNQTREDICKKGDTDFILRTSCMCFSDGCNDSTKFASSLRLLTFSGIVIIISIL